MQSQHTNIYDQHFTLSEQLPRRFSVTFREINANNEVIVVINDEYQLGDIINDNSYENDYYRYHDVFHYTFAALLGWSPCSRAMMKRKRKSDPQTDRIEDGARATITEEAISMVIFNEAKRKDYFNDKTNISHTTLRIVKEMTDTFEVKNKSREEWKTAIFKAYEIFRQLIKNKGGKVFFDMLEKKVVYSSLN